jgi:NAD(P)-dependent dehydrogenase (short-subunit alcohol dehydrogenase family)
MDRVKDKVALITGGASGIGKETALLLAKEGAKVVVTDINKDEGEKVADEINGNGGDAIFLKHDVTEEEDWKQVIEQTLQKFGKLDVLVNNAGVLLVKNIESTSLQEWRWLISINLDGTFLGTKYGIEAMKKSGGGSIINISSTAGIIGGPGFETYGASKGGVRIFTKSAALDCAQAGYNIRVNSVHPSWIGTAMAEIGGRFLGEGDVEAGRKLMDSSHPIGHMGEPIDVAYGVLYLASDESKFVTGSELVIDGGYTAQ